MRILIAALSLSTATAALANTVPDLAPAPSWVKRVALKIPTDSTEAPLRVLLADQQVSLSPGSIARYSENAVLVQNANGLAAGNVSLSWRPDIDTIAVHALTLTRKGKLIDVLAKQKFTVLRRETNLEAAALDGRLTATMIVEGVEVGDVLTLATSVTSRDPTWGNHVESVFAQWNGIPIEQAHSRLHWTRDIPLRVQTSPGLPAFTTTADATGKYIDVSADHVQPLIPPKGAPLRFRVGRYIQATDYRSLGDLVAQFEPLFTKASTIDPKGALAQRIEAIRAASPDPLARATTALGLVQDNVRYVALFMGEGGYLPAQADATWANRLGDCKAKTALLLAMLHHLDIPAVAVLVGSRAGDGIDEQLPSIGAFDHVLVRATIKGRDYWLDGTRTGDRDLSRIETPNFHWGLPLAAKAELVRMLPQAHPEPDTEFVLNIDARSGVYAPAKAHAEVIFRNDDAQATKNVLASLSGASLDNALREYWKGQYSFIQPEKVSASFDAANGIEKVTLDGTAQIKINDTWIRVPGSGLAFTADYSRAAGPGQDAPFLTDYPKHARAVTTISLPPGVDLWPGEVGHDVDETLAGVTYHRQAKLTNNVLHMVKSERTVQPEITAAAARGAQTRLRALDDEDVQLQLADYHLSAADRAAGASGKTAEESPRPADPANAPAVAEEHRFLPSADVAALPEEQPILAAMLTKIQAAKGEDSPAARSALDEALSKLGKPTKLRGLVQFRRAALLDQQGRTADGMVAIEESIRLLPGYSGPLLGAVGIYQYADMPEKAADALWRASELDPGSVRSMPDYEIGGLMRRLEYAHEEAREQRLSTRLLEIGWQGKTAAARSQLAYQAIRAAVAQGDLVQARKLIPNLTVPDNSRALLMMTAYKAIWPDLEAWAGSRLEKQWPIYLEDTRSRWTSSKDLSLGVEYARALNSAGWHRTEAHEFLPLVTQDSSDPNNEEERLFLADPTASALSHTGKVIDAIGMFDAVGKTHALGSEPNALNVWANRGKYLLIAGRSAEAVAAFDAAIADAQHWGPQINSDAVNAMRDYRACALHQVGRKNEAIIAASLLSQRNPTGRANVYLCLGQTAQARDLLIEGLKQPFERQGIVEWLQPEMSRDGLPLFEQTRIAQIDELRRDKRLLDAIAPYGRILPFALNAAAPKEPN